MKFQRSNADPSLFLIMAQEKPEGASELVGTMGLYVDDFLFGREHDSDPGSTGADQEGVENLRT